ADAVVLGLPRGGVPVAAALAARIPAPLDVIVVRKLGAPGDPEYAVGAIGEGGARVLDADAMQAWGVTPADLAAVEDRERRELARRVGLFRRGRPHPDLTGREAVIVDDGIATGSTAMAASASARAFGATRVTVVAPVASASALRRIGTVADRALALETPEPFGAVGRFYREFPQTTDDEVVEILGRASP
ncbi:MAG: phosphoribosyltransferase family protein, partial [Microbacterium sp.]|uniref:phosphoribosyltransferase n=1 Tax=Microbacterium sp. TaxID=51671 RepID=UPI0039E437CB